MVVVLLLSPLATMPLGVRQDPKPRSGFRVVPREELASRKDKGRTDSRWEGIYYLGSDEAYHYFADLYFASSTRLAVRAPTLTVEGDKPFAGARNHWIDVSGHDLNAAILPLATGRKRIAFAFHAFAVQGGAKPYLAHDLGSIAKTEPVPGTQGVRFTVNPAKLRALVDDLGVQAGSWPVLYVDEQQRQLAVHDANNASRLIGLADLNKTAELALLAGRLELVLHNLDQEGADLSAESHFKRALAFDPKHAEANLCYGQLLAGSLVRLKEARALLETAAAQGQHRAFQYLGALDVHAGDRAAAIRCLERHLAAQPDDAISTAAAAAIRNGTLLLPGK